MGKRGGYRIYYSYYPEYGVVLLLAALAKSDREDLTKSDIFALGDLVAEIQILLDKGKIR